jgi:hypothetical protein
MCSLDAARHHALRLVLNVEAFEKRVVYNVAKAFAIQLGPAFDYPELDDVIGISICDFELWPRGDASNVPMLSRWRMQEQRSGTKGLPEIQFVFLELPKYEGGSEPQTLVDKWAYFFREAANLLVIPEALRHPPLLEALEAARTARFTREEWDSYIAAGMAIQNERGPCRLRERRGRPTRMHGRSSPRSGFAASPCRTPPASASWPRESRRGWNAGSRRPSSPRRSTR